MLKKVLIVIATVLALLAASGYAFREELKTFVFAQLTEGMFLEEDLDSYDPGMGLNVSFPAIRVTTQGQVYEDVNDFIGPRGLVVLFSRSVVW